MTDSAPDPATDTGALLIAARDGDPRAIDALLARHQGRLLAYLRVRMGPTADRAVSADDVLQEALVEAARKVETFEYRGGASFYRWLVGIARFKSLEARRARKAGKRAAVRAAGDEPEAPDGSPSQAVLERERGERLRNALAALPPDQAEAVRLRYLEGCTVRETAGTMGRTESAVKSLVSRGLDGLSRRVTRSS